MKKVIFLFVMSLQLALIPAAYSQVHDQLLKYGKLRTDYAQGEGTGSNLLTLRYVALPPPAPQLPGDEGCLFDAETTGSSGCPGRANLPKIWRKIGSTWGWFDVWFGNLQRKDGCGGDPLDFIGDSWDDCVTYDGSPYFSLNNPGSSYWVVVANEDPAFDSECQDGPPGLSHQIVSSGGLYNIRTTGNYIWGLGMHKRVNMKVDASKKVITTNPPCPGDTFSYLSFGSHKGAGNSSYLGTLNRNAPSVDRLRFNMRASSYSAFSSPTTSNVGVHAGIIVVAEWSSKANEDDDPIVYPKFVLVDLLQTGVLAEGNNYSVNSKWNWPVEESLFFPGAEMAVTNAATVTNKCSGINILTLYTTGSQRSYDIDLTDLFECASDVLTGPFTNGGLPSGSINITGVHFFVEEANSEAGHLEIAVDSVRID